MLQTPHPPTLTQLKYRDYNSSCFEFQSQAPIGQYDLNYQERSVLIGQDVYQLILLLALQPQLLQFLLKLAVIFQQLADSILLIFQTGLGSRASFLEGEISCKN